MSAMRLADVTAADVAAARARVPSAFGLGRAGAVGWAVWGLATVYLLWSLSFFGIERLFAASERVLRLIRGFFVWKDMSLWSYDQIYVGIAQTLAMAFLGTLLASLVALVIAFAGARNTMPALLPRQLTRRGLDVLRGIDQLIWGLVFVRAVGLGPLAGVLAIFVNDVGTLAKLYAEAIENIDRKQVEGVRATGADGPRVIRYGYLPQIFPVFLSLSLYALESNARSATILGVVGAGGIGMVLVERFRAGYFDQVAFVVLNVLVCIAVIDWISARIRARFIGQERA